MNKLLLICLLFAGLATKAQTTQQFNDPKAKERQLQSDFDAVWVSSGIQLYLTQADQVALAVSASEERFEERLKTEVVKGVLKIYFDATKLPVKKYKDRQLKAYLSVKDLKALTASAGSIVRFVNAVSVADLSVLSTSGAIVTGAVNLSSLQLKVNSGAVVTLSGSSEKVDITATSGAILNGGRLVSQFCKAHANSGALVEIGVEKELTASANSGGNITYVGEASIIKRSVNSGGTVKKAK